MSNNLDESPAFSIADRMNSIHSQTFLKENVTDGSISSLQDHEIQQTTAYSNGLGKLLQTISWKATPSKQDILTVNEYDILGLPARSFLPFAKAHNSGLFNQTGIQDVQAFYNNPPANVPQSAYPYSEQKKEKSPRLTVLEQSAPGEVWRLGNGHTVKTAERTNSSNEVRYWDLSQNPVSGTTYYTPGVVKITSVTDENQTTSWTYTDLDGRTILKKSMKGSEEVLTYYVYDDYDNLKYIIPPEACKAMAAASNWTLTAAIKDKWVTEFWYDGYQRLTEKKIPEADPIYTVYDNLGRVVLTQDGLLRQQNSWMFTKYDVLGRAVMTGVYAHGSSITRQAMQDLVLLDPDVYETRTDLNYETQHGYTNVAFPNITNCEVWTVTYYDDYDFNNDGSDDYTFANDVEFASNVKFDRLQGKVTGTKTRILTNGAQSFMAFVPVEGPKHEKELLVKDQTIRSTSLSAIEKVELTGEVTLEGEVVVENTRVDALATNNEALPSKYYNGAVIGTTWLISASWYDKYGRVIQSQSNNSLGGTDVSNTEYDFPGKVMKTKTVHQTSVATVTVKKRFEYDHAARLIKTYQQNGTDSEVILAKNSYNELGAMIKKELHSTNSGTSFLQSEDYQYSIRGWLTDLNDVNGIGSDKFAMKLNYDAVDANIAGTGQFNGNIAQQIWSTGSGVKHAYGYTYDALNQLTQANYEKYSGSWNQDAGKYNESATYDLNGNIQTLVRNWNGTRPII